MQREVSLQQWQVGKDAPVHSEAGGSYCGNEVRPQPEGAAAFCGAFCLTELLGSSGLCLSGPCQQSFLREKLALPGGLQLLPEATCNKGLLCFLHGDT